MHMQPLVLSTTDVQTLLHDFHSSDQSSYSERLKTSICQHCRLTLDYSWNQRHQTRGDIDQNICHSLRNAACPEPLAFTLLTEIPSWNLWYLFYVQLVTFISDLMLRSELIHLPHQNLAAMVCYCPVQFMKEIFKLGQRPEMCRMAIYRPRASSEAPGSWQGTMVCTDRKWYKWQMSNV